MNVLLSWTVLQYHMYYYVFSFLVTYTRKTSTIYYRMHIHTDEYK